MEHDALDAGEARYELVISVDARRSGQYSDAEKPRMRERIYRVLETAFAQAGVGRDAVHMEDRGDGVLVSVPGRIAVTRLLGLWMVEVHENLREENRSLLVPLGLRVAMHVGPVRHDSRGISGRAVDLTCRLADSAVARQLLDRERADLVLAVSDSLYVDVVSAGGKFIEPARFSPARLGLKEGEVSAWFHLPGRPAPDIGPIAAEEPGAPAGGPPAAPVGGPEAALAAMDAALAARAAAAAGRRVDDCDGDDEDGADRYRAQGDLSVHRNNVYQQPVHIGRVTGDSHRKD
ncbi:hypothetical protein ACFRMO_33610 [Streptomyces anulatus]|uniref:hypothetical protein n=1 Tax=Streptomyces TaxID=1883 RepID=UPI00067CFAD4|nr:MULTISPECIES: hypothetical protein [Streptomyces]KND31120.1 hypothetical protein IQ60_19550 [Streptomyces europaeiscabiei]KQX37562.1 hypothetical protein ASD29_10490 [Streptomyces sp. Root1295]KRA43369.1 hypothetical protein ASD97_06740 [Streptomyces sp. Root63]OKI83710.1 hypothetical protein AMK12_11250 [Streptomyces sp. TSRI0395]WSC62412.1 hypothetical protein OHA57_17460 [Streptomyces anulatus]